MILLDSCSYVTGLLIDALCERKLVSLAGSSDCENCFFLLLGSMWKKKNVCVVQRNVSERNKFLVEWSLTFLAGDCTP